MFKKTIVLTAITFSIFGGAVYAGVNHYYSDLLYNQKDDISNSIQDRYNEKNEEIGRQVHADMVMFVETEKQRVIDELEKYVDEKLGAEQVNRMNEHSKKIKDTADKMIAELKKEIDELGKDGQ